MALENVDVNITLLSFHSFFFSSDIFCYEITRKEDIDLFIYKLWITFWKKINRKKTVCFFYGKGLSLSLTIQMMIYLIMGFHLFGACECECKNNAKLLNIHNNFYFTHVL